MTSAVTCPVCLDEAAGERECPGCGWTLAGGYLLGHATEDDRREFDRALAAAQARVDLRGALLAAGFPFDGDESLLAQLSAHVRPGAEPGAREEIEASLAAELPALLDEDAVTAAVDRAMRRPNNGFAVIEVSADGVRTAVFRAGELVVELAGAPRNLPWRRLLPSLPAEPARQRLRLAGHAEPVGGTSLLPQGLDVLLLMRVTGWATPERLMRQLHWMTPIRLAPNGRTLTEDGIAQLLALAPLRREVGLAVAEIDPGGTVRLATQPVFRAGTVDGAAEVDITLPTVAGVDFACALVTVENPDPRSWRPRAVHRIGLPPGEQHRIRAVLSAPGHVELRHPGAVSDVDGEWRRLVAGLPATYRPKPVPGADIVFTVELCGDPELVRRRLRLVADTIQLVRDNHPAPAKVRYAVLGYLDHTSARARLGTVVQGCRLGSAADTLKHLTTLVPQALVHERAAPLEDALKVAGVMPWSADRRVLVALGSRAPHPMSEGSAPRCPAGTNWHMANDDLTRAGVHRIAVWDQPAWSVANHPDRYGPATRRFWRQFGRDAALDAAVIGPDDLAGETAVLDTAAEDDPLLFPIVTPGGPR
jgi:hypothetical protein